MKRLEGKVAIVFGAGPNIGGTIANYFAEHGALVTVTDIDEQAIDKTVHFLRARGYDVQGLQGNAMEESDVMGIVDATVKHRGRLDVIMNMAGKVHWSPLLEMKLEDWKDAVLSFPTAGMLTTKYAAKAMIECGAGGSVIHLLSTAAHFGEAAGTAYTAAKAALLNFSRSAAMDLAHDGIRVNTITPCAMEHQLWGRKSGELLDPAFKHPNSRAYYSRDDYLKMIPLERFPRASDLAWAAVFLASDESGFITGADLPVDGGLRFKYPAWRPGNHTGVNVHDYAKQLWRTEFGEKTNKLMDD